MRLQDTTPAKTTLTTAPATALKPRRADGKDAGDQQKVREGVESMFVRQMLEASHMFDGVGGHPMMQGMMLEKLADTVVKGGSLGIGTMVTDPGAAKTPPRPVHGPRAPTASVDDVGAASGLGSADELMLLRPRRDVDKVDMGFGWSISFDDIALPDDMLPRAAEEAIADGRVEGLPEGLSPDEAVKAALARSWRPVLGEPIGATGVIPLAQASSNQVLGEGPKTIRQVGCLLTSMAMVSNTLTGQRRGVEEANEVVTAGGGFKGVNMLMGPAARALGVRLGQRGAFTGDTAAIDAALAKGRPVVVGVDYKEGASSSVGGTDHFLVVTGRTAAGSYTGIDSGNGKPLVFQPDADGALRSGRYRLSEFMTVEPAAVSAPTVAQARGRWDRVGG